MGINYILPKVWLIPSTHTYTAFTQITALHHGLKAQPMEDHLVTAFSPLTDKVIDKMYCVILEMNHVSHFMEVSEYILL